VHTSGTSHSPAAGRQTVPVGTSASAGQVALDPVHRSAGSHSPADARQTVVAGLKVSAGQNGSNPEQVSATSHDPAADRQTVPAGSSLHADEQQSPSRVLPSSHSSSSSRIPFPHPIWHVRAENRYARP